MYTEDDKRKYIFCFMHFRKLFMYQCTQLLREEELKWFPRAKTTRILKGDSNTKYFHMVANGKRRKTRIF
jgi:hypothetical protein